MKVLVVTPTAMSVVEANSTTAASFAEIKRQVESGLAVSKVATYPAVLKSTKVLEVVPSADGLTFVCQIGGRIVPVAFVYQDGKDAFNLHNPHAVLAEDVEGNPLVSLQLIANDGALTPFAFMFRNDPLANTY